MDFLNVSTAQFLEFSFYWQTIIFIVIGYLIGSLNFGQIYSRVKKVDLGKVGSKNYGATNTGRNFGIKGFLFVFCGDFFKGFIAIAIMAAFFFTGVLGYGSVGIGLFFVLIGHSWPVYFKFKGGKGVASFIAIAIILNWLAAIIGLIMFVFLLFISRRVSIASITFAISTTFLITLTPFVVDQAVFLPEWSFQLDTIIAAWLATFLIIYKHRSNLRNIYTMQESYVTKLDNVNVGLRNRIKLIWRQFIRLVNIYTENTIDLTNDLIGGSYHNNIFNEIIENNTIRNNVQNEEIISPYTIDEKNNIKVSGINFSPSTRMRFIYEVKNLKSIRRFRDDLIVFQIKEKNDIKDIEKSSQSRNIIAEVTLNKYFGEKAIEAGAKILQINPYLTPHLEEITKIGFKKKIPIILYFSFETINNKFLIENTEKELMFFKAISDVLNNIEEKYEDLSQFIISIEHNKDIDLIRILELISIIYKCPIILSVRNDDAYNIANLIPGLKLINLVNYVCINKK